MYYKLRQILQITIKYYEFTIAFTKLRRFSVANYDHDRTISWDSLIICFSVWYNETFCLDLFVSIGTAERHIIIWERFKIVTFVSYLRQIPPFSLLLGRFCEDFIPISRNLVPRAFVRRVSSLPPSGSARFACFNARF